MLLTWVPTPQRVRPDAVDGLDVGDGGGVGAGAHGVLGVVDDVEVHAEAVPGGAHEGVDRAVALAGQRVVRRRRRRAGR